MVTLSHDHTVLSCTLPCQHIHRTIVFPNPQCQHAQAVRFFPAAVTLRCSSCSIPLIHWNQHHSGPKSAVAHEHGCSSTVSGNQLPNSLALSLVPQLCYNGKQNVCILYDNCMTLPDPELTSNKAAGEKEVIWAWIKPSGLQTMTISWPRQLPA